MVWGGGAAGSSPMVSVISSVAGLELVDLSLQGGDAGAGGGVVHSAVLERGEVPVDRGLLVLDLGVEGAGFGVPVSVAVAVAGLGAGDGVGDEGGGLGVEVGEGVEDGGVGVVGGERGRRRSRGCRSGRGRSRCSSGRCGCGRWRRCRCTCGRSRGR